MGIVATDATILIVEDNADNLYIVTDILRWDLQARYVDGYTSGIALFQALQMNQQIKPDLILLDLQIPNEDGFSVLRQIRANLVLSTTTVIAVTANVMPEDIERTRQAGFNGFIGKPLDADRLPRQVQRILNGESVWEPR